MKAWSSRSLALLSSCALLVCARLAQAQQCAVTTPIGAGKDEAFELALQPDGRILLGGTSFSGTNDDFALVRYNADLTLDTALDVDGKVTTNINATDAGQGGLVVQPDGKILLGGQNFIGGPSDDDFVAVRYNPNGTLDTSFDGDGKAITPVDTLWDIATAMARQPDGKIVLAGYARVGGAGGQYDFAIVRYNVDGTLDTSFGTSGKVVTAVGPADDWGNAMLIQPDGKILLAGATMQATNDFAMVRYNPNGTLDASFGASGIVITPIGAASDWGSGVALQPDGKIVFAGQSFTGANIDVAVLRYNANGTLDGTFGAGGIVLTAVGPGDDYGRAVTVQPDGKIVVAGTAFNGANDDVLVLRYHPNGTLDASFSGDGIVTTPIGAGNEMVGAVALQSDGRILVGGSSHNGANLDFALVRYGADGSLDPTCIRDVFYSVGTSLSDLKSGNPTVTIANGNASFSAAQPANVGVGDELTYNGGTKAYITRRTSSTQYTVATRNGFTPPDVNAVSVNLIRRAFNSLNSAITGSSDANHLNGANLVTGNARLHLAAYNDGPMSDSLNVSQGVHVNGYTTGASSYIRIFAPASLAEVGISQRHTGVAGTGFRLTPSLTPGAFFSIVDVDVEHLRLEGLELDGSLIINAREIDGVHIQGIATAGTDFRFDKLLIHDFINAAGTGFIKGISIQDGNLKLSNSIVYGLTNTSTNGADMIMGVELNETTATHYVFNNTIFDIKQTGAAGGAQANGLVAWSGNTTARNNFVGDVVSTSGSEFCYRTITTQSNNVSSDGTATGATGQTAYASYFVSVTPGSEDLHLLNDSSVLWGISGMDLDSDPNLPVVDDVDGGPRDATTPDVSADERGATSLALSLSDHGLGQIGDRFGTSSPVTDVLLRFRLTRVGSVTVDTLRVGFTTGTGVANGDVTSAGLYLDVNGDGLCDGGDTPIQTGVAPLAGVITFTANFQPGLTASPYLVCATVSNLGPGDTTTFSLDLAGIDTVESGVVESGTAANATHVTDALDTVYYSVGTSTLDLKTGSPNITIAGGVATLTVAQTGNVGVGDVIDYNLGSKAYIHAVLSPTVFQVRTATGLLPADVGPAPVSSIRRTFNDWATAIASSGTASYLGTFNLTTAQVRIVWVGYNDAPFDVVATTTINGYTTNASYYLTATVAGAADVASGVSQRHTGVAGTGTRLRATAGGITILRVDEVYTRVEWLELDGNGVTPVAGLYVLAGGSSSQLQKVLVHHTRGDTNTGPGIFLDVGANFVEIRNAIVYDYDGDGVHVSGSSARIYNSTFHLGRTVPASQSVQTDNAGSALLENVLAIGPETDFFENTPGSLTLNNCMSSDTTADDFLGTGNLVNVNPSTQFMSISGVIDLHLKPGSNAIDAGKNLTGTVNDDVDGQTRFVGAQFDVGADETSAGPVVPLYRSVGTNGANLNASAFTVAISGTTATFSGAMPANVGVGDVLQYQVGAPFYVAFIQSRSSSTVYTVANATGGLPQPAAAGTAVGVYRAYTSLAQWELLDENDTLDNTVENFDTSTNLVTGRATMQVAAYADGPDGPVTIGGWTTGPGNYIRIFTPVSVNEVGQSQRHQGVWDVNRFRVESTGTVVSIQSNYVRIEGLQVRSTADIFDYAAIELTGSVGASEYHVSHSIIRGVVGTQDTRFGVNLFNAGTGTIKVWNNIIYDWEGGSSLVAGILPDDVDFTFYLSNNTIVDCKRGIENFAGTVIAKNNLVYNSSNGNYAGAFSGSSTNNLSGPVAAGAPGINPRNSTAVAFVNAAGDDFHLQTGDTGAKDFGANLAFDPNLAFTGDVDGGLRQSPWDIGADDVAATTEVELVSFEALPLDAAVELSWQTASEIRNLGFHLYRALPGARPERVTELVIPGLGSSPSGARYQYRDAALVNGTTYSYWLEDIETTGRTERHGPVLATPQPGLGSGIGSAEPGRITYGNPEASTFRVLERTAKRLVLELRTEGFYGFAREDGTVSLVVPGYQPASVSGSASIPVKRAWVEVPGGGSVRIAAVRAEGLERIDGLPLAAEEEAEVVASRDGTVRARRRIRKGAAAGRGIFPGEAARVLDVGFQSGTAKAHVELAPLRWEAATGSLLLARRLVVELSIQGRTSESTARRLRQRGAPIARLSTTAAGLYGVRFETLSIRGGIRTERLRLSRHGDVVPYHVTPEPAFFGPGSTLYFASAGAELNPYGMEALYDLELTDDRGSLRMEVRDGAPGGAQVDSYRTRLRREENRLYQAALLDAPDLWLWDVFVAPVSRSYTFRVEDLASGEARMRVWLQGTSDFEADPDHHVRVAVNGAFATERFWNGKDPVEIEVDLPPGVLVEGNNTLELEALHDTGASYSMWMIDRFEIDYESRAPASSGRVEGTWTRSGAAVVTGLSAAPIVVDTTGLAPRWIDGAEFASDGTARFRAEAGRRYLVTASNAVHSPAVRRPKGPALARSDRGADYLVIAPEAFLDEARPLLEHRRSEGLRVDAVATEQIYEEFGYGEATPAAIRDFLGFAYHEWRKPAIRYVLLLGDATYDFKDYLGTGVTNRVPALLVRTQLLWTASDPTLAMVNGEDPLPDVAIGRLPAATEAEARAMVAKTLAFERGGIGLSSPFVLVADDPDAAGNFSANAEEIARTVLSGRETRKLYLEALGPAALRDGIRNALDEGASLVSYVGHGGIHLWASENVFDVSAVSRLSPQTHQPLVVTVNCLNGYFHFPYFNSLAEELVKAADRGAIAAFSPSGLSFDRPAHEYHKALLAAVLQGGHHRLGDAVLEAQSTYAGTGALPELLAIYHLIGDPALRLH
jgi:uncharacterized delta-60 repeat protein